VGLLKAAVIAAGSQGRVHAAGYRADPRTTLVAVADVSREAAEALSADLDIPQVFTDYEELLSVAKPDILSICTPPASHLAIVRAAVAAGVRAIHCEKPIALSYGDALDMVALAEEAGVQLTFNLQRRFEPVHLFAKSRLTDGAIGDVVSVEGYCPNLPDWGTHIFDLVLFYLGDESPEWVLGQIDVSTNRYVYNAFAETSSVTLVKWASGVNATVFTGREPQTPILNLANNTGIIIQGTKGRIEARGARADIFRFGEATETFDSPFERDSSKWERGVDPAIVAATADAIADAVTALESGSEPALGARHGLAGAELIFATYESSRIRGRVTLPLETRDNALLSGLDAGYWSPVGEQRSTY
jgi:UDP-N-acetylglucosamine 3-dehydrogenase